MIRIGIDVGAKTIKAAVQQNRFIVIKGYSRKRLALIEAGFTVMAFEGKRGGNVNLVKHEPLPVSIRSWKTSTLIKLTRKLLKKKSD